MYLFPPYFFVLLAVNGFVLGYTMKWFLNRSIKSIALGIGGVTFIGLIVLDRTLPGQPADPIDAIATLGFIYSVGVGVPALFGAAVARNLKEEVLK